MRIVVVNSFYPPRVGGSAHLSESLAKGYAAAGHEVLVLTASYSGAPSEEVRDGIRIVRLPSAGLPKTPLSVNFDIPFVARPSLRRRLDQILGDFAPEVMHQHGQFFDLTWATGLWAQRNAVPALLSVHTRLESPAALYSTVFTMLDRVLVTPFLRRYRPRFVVMDRQMDHYIDTRYAPGPGAKEFIPVGVDTAWTGDGDGPRARSVLALPDEPIILSLGHVIPLRDRLALVEALPQVLAAIPTAKLVVVGEVYYDAFVKRAEELGVADAVVCVGRVPKAEVPDYLAAAQCEAHDLQGYGLGTASLEAMAAGVPVVAAVRSDNFPGIALESGKNCQLVELGDTAALAQAIVWSIANPDAAAEIAHRQQALVREYFEMDVVIGRHLEVLQAMAAEQRGELPGATRTD